MDVALGIEFKGELSGTGLMVELNGLRSPFQP